jgi:hypothetical protein
MTFILVSLHADPTVRSSRARAPTRRPPGRSPSSGGIAVTQRTTDARAVMAGSVMGVRPIATTGSCQGVYSLATHCLVTPSSRTSSYVARDGGARPGQPGGAAAPGPVRQRRCGRVGRTSGSWGRYTRPKGQHVRRFSQGIGHHGPRPEPGPSRSLFQWNPSSLAVPLFIARPREQARRTADRNSSTTCGFSLSSDRLTRSLRPSRSSINR